MPCFSTQLTPQNQFLVSVCIFDDQEVRKHKNLDVVVRANPNPKPYKALIDTGANGSCISEEIAQELNLTPTCKKQMMTAGDPVECNEYDVHICIPITEPLSFREVKEGEKIIHLPDDFVVHARSWKSSTFGLPQQDSERGYDCLLGMDILKDCTFQYDRMGRLTVCF